ncbi:MAG: thiol:disulfide interchange protein DsbA/DsbL [Glaciecola sp.]|jgi:thiol:disulfide interchange protein DsbA|nr:thiol:disulfide interchange protein DsbA/DsbL [Glaciecola sp.]MDG1469615.1 thiol:disulfide interchange protein DsbA/DsbL [Glaciecola sp.]MDG1921446.1 thiol:disulfide interchange protein DsbA/DsbL [Glaciecola sp.]
MKKTIISIAFAVLSVFISAQASAQIRFVENEHYKVISDEATAKPEVKEFFSFWCPHCFNFEPLVAEMKKNLDPSVKFDKVHVNFMGFAGQDLQDDVTKAMMIGRALDKSEQVNLAIFNFIHRQRGRITNATDVRTILVDSGIDATQFDKMNKSFAVNSMLKKNNKAIDQFRRHVSGVPNFIVNGKFQAQFTRDMTPDDMVDLIVFLSTMK